MFRRSRHASDSLPSAPPQWRVIVAVIAVLSATLLPVLKQSRLVAPKDSPQGPEVPFRTATGPTPGTFTKEFLPVGQPVSSAGSMASGGTFNDGLGFPMLATIAGPSLRKVFVRVDSDLDGSFPAMTTLPKSASAPMPNPSIVLIGDFNNDGNSDIFVAGADPNHAGLGLAVVFLGNGNGTWNDPEATGAESISLPEVPTSGALTFFVADSFGNNINQAVVTLPNHSALAVIMASRATYPIGAGTPLLTQHSTSFGGIAPSVVVPFGVESAFVSGGPIDDVVFLDQSGNAGIARFDTGTFAFTQSASFSTPGATAVCVGNIAGIGNFDIAVRGPGITYIFLETDAAGDPFFDETGDYGDNVGGPTHTTTDSFTNATGPILAVDTNGDETADVLVASALDQSVNVYLSPGDGTLCVPGGPTFQSVGAPLSLAGNFTNGLLFDDQMDVLILVGGVPGFPAQQGWVAELLNTSSPFTPVISNLTIKNITPTSAQICWTGAVVPQAFTVTGGVVLRALTGSPIGVPGTPITTTQWQTTLTGLLPGTTYSGVAVLLSQDGFGFGEESDSAPLVFSTPPNIPGAPFQVTYSLANLSQGNGEIDVTFTNISGHTVTGLTLTNAYIITADAPTHTTPPFTPSLPVVIGTLANGASSTIAFDYPVGVVLKAISVAYKSSSGNGSFTYGLAVGGGVIIPTGI